jgi:phosphatidylinositol alpha-1,6-mannosyltransferase
MRVVVTSEFHYLATPRGVMIAGKCDYAYWAPLLEVFDEVRVFARLGPGTEAAGMTPVEGPGVALCPAPPFVATRGLARAVPGLAAAAWRAAASGDVFLLHAPGAMASALRPALVAHRKPYAVEVVGDPEEALVGAGRALAALRGVMARDLRAAAAGACATRYVTQAQLQRRYPPRPGAPTFAISDAYIPDAVFAGAGATITDDPVLALGFVGALFRPYKGLDVLLDALARTARPHTLEVVGDGQLRAGLEAQAARLGLGARVRFLGALPPGEAVYRFLRTRAAFVQPSRTEGLPRSLLEAMAVGLPALATAVGGVPELLDADELVRVDDAGALAQAIDRLAADPARRRRLAAENRQKVARYAATPAQAEMRRFFEAIRDAR